MKFAFDLKGPMLSIRKFTVLEYLSVEVPEVADDATHDNEEMCILPLRLRSAIRNNEGWKTLERIRMLSNTVAVLLTKKVEKMAASKEQTYCLTSEVASVNKKN
ncbi:Histone H2A [Taenia solium]|eukprot:TsM_000049900 transcript=TsM_000049900 gene=TsM_000049900